MWFLQISLERWERIDLSRHKRGTASKAHGRLSADQYAPLLDNNYRSSAAAKQTDRINHNKLELDDGVRAEYRCRIYRLLTEQVA